MCIPVHVHTDSHSFTSPPLHLPTSHSEEYHVHRLQSGIPDGINKIAVGNSLPLEFNLEYMNGGIGGKE